MPANYDLPLLLNCCLITPNCVKYMKLKTLRLELFKDSCSQFGPVKRVSSNINITNIKIDGYYTPLSLVIRNSVLYE